MDESFSTTVFNNFGTTGPATDTDTFNPGPVVNLGAGYRLPYGFRIEGELGYAYYTADTISPLSTNGAFPALTGARLPLQSGGERDQYSFTTNAFYDLPVAGQFVPYVGAGVGVYHGTGPGARFTLPNGGIFTSHLVPSTNALILAEAGITVTLDEHWAIVPAYRYEHLFEDNPAAVNANIFKLGVRYSF